MMNIKDDEEQEDMEISEKEDDTACNIYHTLWKTYTKKKMWLIFNKCEIIMYVVCSKCVPADTDLDHDFNCFKCSA